jgi:hypothetical protein
MSDDVETFRHNLIADAALRYPKYATDQVWMFNLYFQPWGYLFTFGEEAAKAAMWVQLDMFAGDAYSAFARSHDGGFCVTNYLRNGGNTEYLIHPIPPDTRFAPVDNEIQEGFLDRGLDLYGNPMVEFHRNEGAQKWADFASKPPYNAYNVPPATARWLLLNNLISGGNDPYVWNPFRGLDIAAAVIVIESVNHPGANPPA